ncbi:hypothetical protein IEO21_07093 [Rhodonia placenta]|uniref:F-box domain-containing protein n=1 Tax=Rhodonia placenta TaxID=104341 RepID=A0A8H7NZ53_9APHY|nr:hypothetical protein IEO21_07093 [Postia placenta]
MPHFLDLNYDVLHLIITLLSQNDIFGLALSCRKGFDLALPQILYRIKFPPLDIAFAIHLCGFCSFVLADVVRRAPLVRILELDLRMYSYFLCLNDLQVGEYAFPMAIMKILEHASNLQELTFNPPEYLIQDHPSLLSAAVALPRLDSLTVSSSAPGPTIVSAVISRPRKLVLNFFQRSSRHTWNTLVSNLLQSGIAAYVENLHLIKDDYLSAMPSLQFPRLHHITVSDARIPIGSSFYLAGVFPNLHSLYWEKIKPRSSDKGTISITTRSELDHVQFASCDILPLVGPVRRLTLTKLYERYEIENNIVTALERAAPVVLHLDITRIKFDLAHLSAVAPSIRFLRLQVHSTWKYRLPPSLRKMPLVAVSIFFEVKCRKKYVSDAGSILAELVARNIPSVEYVEVNLCAYRLSPHYDHQRDRTEWHRVTSREADKCTVEKLPQWESDKVEDRLLAMTRV